MSVVSVGQSGAAEKVLLYSSGTVTSAADIISNAVIKVGGTDLVVVSSGGMLDGVTVSAGGSLSVEKGGSATGVELKSGGILGGFSFGSDYLWDVVEDKNLSLGDNVWMNGNILSVDSDGMLAGAAVYAGGEMQVVNSGAVNSITINFAGSMSVSLDGVANNTVIKAGGEQLLMSGGTANNTRLEKDGLLLIGNGGIANSAAVSAGGEVFISGGGAANNAVLYNSGTIFVYASAAANNAVVSEKNAELCVFGGSAAFAAVSAGAIRLKDGGTANYTAVHSGGTLAVYDSGRAVNNTLNSGASAVVSGGLLKNTTIKSGAVLDVKSGGKVGGTLKIESGASVNFAAGSVFDFTVSERIAADGYLINDLSLLKGTPSFTITVSDAQATGTYKLAQGAANFTGSITIGTSTETCGKISVGSAPLVVGDRNYLLRLSDGNLTLTVSPGTSVIPGTVTNLTVTSTSTYGTVKLSWKKADDGIPVTSYRIVVDGVEYTSKTTSITIKGISAGSHVFRVYAINADNNSSGPSEGKLFSIADITAPSKVTGLKVDAKATDKETTLKWNVAADDVGATKYWAYVDGQKFETTTNSITLKGLAVGSHNLKVYAFDAAGNKSAVSATLKFSVSDGYAPDKVTGLKAASGASSKTAKLSWKAAKDNIGTTSYQVYIDGKLHSTVKKTSISISGLKVGTRSLVVYALDAAGNKSAASATYKFKVADKTAPTKVTGLKAASGASSESAKLSWSAASDNVKVTGYQVYINNKLYKTVTGTSVTVSGLKVGNCSMKIYAVDAAGNKSAASATYKFKVADKTAPPVVTGLKAASGASSKTAKLSWKAPKDNVKTTSYQVYIDGKLHSTVKKTSISISGLKVGTRSLVVYALDAAGNKSAASATYKFKVVDKTAPDKVTGLKAASGASSESAKLSWNAASDNVKTTSYQVYINNKLYKTVTGTSITVSGLKVGNCSMKIYAVDAAGNKSAASAKLNFTVSAPAKSASAASRIISDDTMASAIEATGKTLSGYVDAQDTVDWYKFDITEADTYAFGVSSCSGAVKTSLRDADGDLINAQSLAASSSAQTMIRELSAGTYYFCVEKNSAASDYTVNFPANDDDLLKGAKLA